jgi:hypothetical protein
MQILFAYTKTDAVEALSLRTNVLVEQRAEKRIGCAVP